VVTQRALMQLDCLYPFLSLELYNHILLCEWVLEHCSAVSVSLMACHVTQHSHFI